MAAAAVALAACSAPGHGAEPAPAASSHSIAANAPPYGHENHFLAQVGESLINLHQGNRGGWEYKSKIQKPNDQTDRDVGAASVGMGFLVLADRYPNDHRWLKAAGQTATWLLATANRDKSGNVWWNDFVDGSRRSNDIYTSFDDGALGIGDFFWRLYEKTGNEQYKATALGTVKWTLAQAENVGSADQPAYRWLWDLSSRGQSQDSNNPPVYSMGMGMGAVGTVNTLATYYERTRTSDPAFAAQCQQYIEGGLRYIQMTRRALGRNVQTPSVSRALPETGRTGWNGDTEMDSGYLSGAAGAAYMYLNLYHIFGDKAYLTQANELLSWLQDTQNGPMARFRDGSVAWHIAIDPQDAGNPDNAKLATGFEEGSAGIGWTFLQAYNVTGNTQYLEVAKDAATWLLKPGVVIKDGQGGYSWREDENPASQDIHPNLDNGAAGTGMYLYDLYQATMDPRYLQAAQGAASWLKQHAVHHGKLIYWQDRDGRKYFARDPSWHWGLAGEIDFLARLNGGKDDIPGEQDALGPIGIKSGR